jgi:hypothetical protein
MILFDHAGKVVSTETSDYLYSCYHTCYEEGLQVSRKRDFCCGVRVKVICSIPQGHALRGGKVWIDDPGLRGVWVTKQLIKTLFDMLRDRHPKDVTVPPKEGADLKKGLKWHQLMHVYLKLFLAALGGMDKDWEEFMGKFQANVKRMSPEVMASEMVTQTNRVFVTGLAENDQLLKLIIRAWCKMADKSDRAANTPLENYHRFP